MDYKKHSWPKFKPDGKANCIVWLDSGEKVTARYHVKREAFIGLYGEYEGKVLFDVKEWDFAILQRSPSNQFDDMLTYLLLENGDIVLQNAYSRMNYLEQKRLNDEVELAGFAIGSHFKDGE